jgi:hypothetical protein
MDTNQNITFFLEDTFDEIDNMSPYNPMVNDLVGQLLQNVDEENVSDIDPNCLLNDLSYCIKKELYCGNDELYYDEEYKIKDLMKICKYYGIASSVKASKCKKQDIISTIIYFENSPENYNIVFKRHKMWAYMTELLEDPKMKEFLLW